MGCSARVTRRGAQQVRRAGVLVAFGGRSCAVYAVGMRRDCSRVPVCHLQRYETPVRFENTWREQLVALKPEGMEVLPYSTVRRYVAMSLWWCSNNRRVRARTFVRGFACSVFLAPGGYATVGGYFSDKWGAHRMTWWVMWVSWICLFLLSYPATTYTVQGVNGPMTFTLAPNIWTFTLLMFVLGVAWAFGKASVFKYIADDYPGNIGVISGIVGLPADSALHICRSCLAHCSTSPR